MAGTTLIHYDTVELPRGVIADSGTKNRLISTIGMLTVPKDTSITSQHVLQVDLIAIVKVEDDKYVIVDHQVDEYGIGDSFQEAQQDLFESLIDYRISLERREDRLGDRERLNLQILRSMFNG